LPLKNHDLTAVKLKKFMDMETDEPPERVQVMRGKHRDSGLLFGPLPGFRMGEVVAYEFQLPDRFEPWPGRTLVERTFVLLDVGVCFANPCWVRARNPDGTLVEVDLKGRDSWYVDLVAVSQGEAYVETIHTLALEHRRLREILDGVSQGAMPKRVWHRIEILKQSAFS